MGVIDRMGGGVAGELTKRLANIVGASHVLTDPEVTAGYVTDWTGRWRGSTRAVVRPGSTSEVADVVRLCASHGVSIVPQGGNTGLVGGSVPHDGEVVVSLRRLDHITEIDTVGRTISAEAGVTLARADAAAGKVGLAFPVDIASRDTATLGGITATNAGGVRVVRHGPARAQIVGIEAVLADGSVIRRWSGLAKDSVGYDLPGLLCGSEGTLAIITAVRMRLVAPPDSSAVSLVAVPTLLDASQVLGMLISHGAVLEAAEFMMRAGFDLVRRFAGLSAPFSTSAPAYLLTETSAIGTERLAGAIADAGAQIIDAVIEPHPARRLWTFRESLPDAVSTAGTSPALKLDVAVPARHLDEFVASVGELAAQADAAATPIVFGHLAEGNAHVNVLDVPAGCAYALTDAVLHEVVRLNGSISAEHGIGAAKREWMTLSRSSADIAAMRSIKQALDPARLLNPNAVFPPEG